MKDSTAAAAGKEQPKKRRRSQMTEIWRRMRRNKLAMVGLVICLLYTSPSPRDS